NRMSWWLHTRRRKVRLHRLRIAVNEIKNSVSACTHSGDQIRPSHWTLRRNAGGKRAERSLLGQCREVRHFALRNILLQKLRVQAINAEDDEFLIAMPSLR